MVIDGGKPFPMFGDWTAESIFGVPTRSAGSRLNPADRRCGPTWPNIDMVWGNFRLQATRVGFRPAFWANLAQLRPELREFGRTPPEFGHAVRHARRRAI